MKYLITVIFIASFSLFAAVDGSVTATKLNIRVKAGTKYAGVAQVKKGSNPSA